LDIETAFRSILGGDLAPADETRAIDDVSPRYIGTPTSEGQLADVLAAATALGAAIVPWGGGLHVGVGNVPQSYDLGLDTTSLDSVCEYEPADLTITVGAGMALGELQATLDKHGQFWPVDGPVHATLGGLLAVGYGGPSEHAHGPPRDWVLGCRLALANGDVVRAGGRVVKNVAGYDLTRMAVGSLGTLGVLTEVTLKVVPQPPVQSTMLAACVDTETAIEKARAIAGRGLALRAIVVVENQLACLLAGPQAAVDRTRRELRDIIDDAETQEFAGEQADRWWASLDLLDATSEVMLRVSVPPSRVPEAMRYLISSAEDAGLTAKRIAHPTTGIVIGRIKGGTSDAYVRVVESVRSQVGTSASVVVTKAHASVKRLVDVWGNAPGVDIMRALKREFDPTSTLNPGRLVGGI